MNESLDSRQLKAFVVLAKTGSHTETAKQLYVTHSAISHSMRALEEQIGCRLLTKLGKKAILTEAGDTFLPYAHRTLEEMRQARRAIAELNKWGTRRLRLATTTAFLSKFLTPVLVKFHNEFPTTLLKIESCGTSEPISRLNNNHADVVLAEKPSADAAIEFIPLLADRFHLVVNSTHPLATKKNISRDDFGKYSSLLLHDSSQSRKQIEDFLNQRGIGLNIIGEVEDLNTLKEFITHTQTMSLLPGWCIGTELKNQTLVSLPLSRPPLEGTWGFMHLQSRPLNQAEAALLKLCRKRVAELE